MPAACPSVSGQRSLVISLFAGVMVAIGLTAACRAGLPGFGEAWLHRSLRATARFSFLLFWFAYTGRALPAVFGSRLDPIARHVREFGLAFAGAHIVHVGVAIWLYQTAADPPMSPLALAAFGVGAVMVCLLAIMAIPAAGAVAGTRLGRGFRAVMVQYLLILFLFDFAHHPMRWDVLTLAGYVPFLAMIAFAVAVRPLSKGLFARASPGSPAGAIRIGL